MPLRIKRIYIKPEECMAHCLCESELPKGSISFETPKGHNYEVAVLHQNKLPRNKESLLLQLQVADVCPMDAFYIELEDGTELNVWNDYVQKQIKLGDFEWV